MLRLVRRRNSPYWYIRGTVRGIYVEESTRTADRKAAEALRIRRESELLETSVYGRRTTATFEEAAVLYMESGGERRFVAQLLEHFAGRRLHEIDQAAADAAARALYPEASAATRVRQVYTPLAAILNHAARSGLCAPVRFRRPRATTPVRPAAEPEELEAFLAAAPPRLAALALFMALTGRRIGEAVRLTWGDVNLGRGEALIRRTKNGEPAVAHLPPAVVAALANLPGAREERALIFGYSSRHSVYGAWRRACARAKIRSLSPHEMGRHTFATWMRRYAGLDLRALMEAGGWKSVQSVLRYAKVDPEETAHAADRLGEVLEKSGKRAAK